MLTNIEGLRKLAQKAATQENNFAKKPFLDPDGLTSSFDVPSLRAIWEISDLRPAPQTIEHVKYLETLEKKGRILTSAQIIVLALSRRDPGI
ncbi:hypothetical protein A2972_02815 [Candidatus Amesbacteria bacterium RIFCSPLOWO2_01_FULL_47_33]|uniref:Uncharacterized protein n=3 Tax=Candidatus Amesiibacteriota TaxID=1752730 RepID=A0A1F4ZTA5_9BACT|nr:MAG: hypothetical protein UX86_C0019G0022 [Candidatus Amesbacteria bacterium GW2011_GWC1_47_15]OGD00156.1 MAG: hypothetical protein A2972_02815 [Candidatus Amesbacteria bacterium RIFCSPLOWO2_01_FULL_47_33]OGD09601.1 MAG: hypothetical protein A2395_01305 [Candidatus Amesbacteria bacterium RIFOXYB1_FULL_47_9]